MGFRRQGPAARLRPVRLDGLIASARRQADLLEELRVRAADRIIDADRQPMARDQHRLTR